MPALLLALLLAAVAGSTTTPRVRREAQAQQQQGGADPTLNYGDYVHHHGSRAGTPGFTYPACSIQESLNQDGMICVAGSGWLALTQIVPPQLGTGSTVEAPLDPTGDLPRALQAVAKPLPAQIPAAVVEQEKPSYYFGAFSTSGWGRDSIESLAGTPIKTKPNHPFHSFGIRSIIIGRALHQNQTKPNRHLPQPTAPSRTCTGPCAPGRPLPPTSRCWT